MTGLAWTFLGIAIVLLPFAFLGVAYIVFLVRNRKAIRTLIEREREAAGSVRGVTSKLGWTVRCLSCRVSGEWFCGACESEYSTLYVEVKTVARFLGEEEREGPIVLSASKILEAHERVENTTSLGKATWMARARDLLMEVEDYFKYTPMCPSCKLHKMELITGDPMKVTCTASCEF